MQFSEFQQTVMAHRYQQEVSIPGVRVRTTWFPVIDMASGSTSVGHYMEFASANQSELTRLDQTKHGGFFHALTTNIIWLKTRIEALEALHRWMNGGPFPGQPAVQLVDAAQPDAVAASTMEASEGAKGGE